MKDLTDSKNQILITPEYQNPNEEVMIVSCRLLGKHDQYLNIVVAVPAREQLSRETVTCFDMPEIKVYKELRRNEHCKIAQLISRLLKQYSLTCIEFHDLGSTISYLVG